MNFREFIKKLTSILFDMMVVIRMDPDNLVDILSEGLGVKAELMLAGMLADTTTGRRNNDDEPYYTALFDNITNVCLNMDELNWVMSTCIMYGAMMAIDSGGIRAMAKEISDLCDAYASDDDDEPEEVVLPPSLEEALADLLSSLEDLPDDDEEDD